ncbi:4014_t:CDS:2 [Ambispora leptoticha]|uniref:4014_t:CDS:1 n=1 Tax=Ambispora leptoticha TaxID=144679 RepID=A0A9N9EDU1_9GLOM|nr:4014_t:CDS:2 [Ambispora leptoticha]
MWIATPPTSGSSWVRRRRWFRVMKRRSDSMEAGVNFSLLQPIKSYDDPTDYLKRAADIINKEIGKGKAVNLQDELTRYQDAIKILMNGINSDTNMQRRQEASSLAQTFLKHAEFLENKLGDARSSDESTSPTSKDLSNISRSNSGIANQLNNFRSDSTTSLSSFQTVDDPSWTTSSSNLDARSSSIFSGSTLLQSTGVVTGISKLNASATPTSNPGYTWEQDEDVQDCRRCHKKFGLLNRRHHCRKCGQVVCDGCSTARVELSPAQLIFDPSGKADLNPNQSSKLHRVCDSCKNSLGYSGQRSNSLTASITSGVSFMHNHQRRPSTSSMSHCPACSEPLSNFPGGQDEHIRTCFENNRNGNNVNGFKYVGEQATFCA